MEGPVDGGFVQRKAILIIFSVLLFSLPLLTWLHLHRELQRELDKQYAFVNQLYAHLSEQRLALLHAVVDQISLRADVQQSLRNGDRQHLLQMMQPVMEHLAGEQGVSLLYFHDARGKTLLRVHQPEIFGERLNRYLLRAALQKKEAVQGLEIGPQGLLSLRVAFPLEVDGTLLGFIELGEDVNGVVQELKAITGSRLLLTVNKDFISRHGWETGLLLTNRENSWDLLPGSVIPHNFASHFSPEMLRRIFEKERTDGDAFRINLDGEHHAGKIFLLRDTVSAVGNLLVMRDITQNVQRGQLLLLASIFFSVILAGLLRWLPPRKL
jgi:two-component system, NtrC family, sensor kinase